MARGFVDVEIGVQERGVEALLHHLDTALNPVAIAGFLGAVVDPYVRKRIKSRFASEGDDVTGKWAPLGEATQSIRQQMGYGASHPINQRTGELERFITGAPNALTLTPTGAMLTMPGSQPTGELMDKFSTAQKGRVQPRTVARPVIGLNEQDLAFVLTELLFHVVGGRTS